MQENKAKKNPGNTEEEYEPVGAISISLIMLATVLIFWFSVFLLNYVRS